MKTSIIFVLILISVIPMNGSAHDMMYSPAVIPMVEVNGTEVITGPISIAETYIVTAGGNLTIIDATVTGSVSLTSLIFLDEGGILNILNSSISVGTTAVSTLINGIQAKVTITGSTFSNFVDDVIALDGAINLLIKDTVFTGNSKDAIDLDDFVSPAIITGVTVLNNGKDGLHISDSDAVITDFYVDGLEGGQAIQLINPGQKTKISNVFVTNIVSQEGIKIEDPENSNVSISDVIMTKVAQEAIRVGPDLNTKGTSDLYLNNISIYDVSDDAIQIDGTTGSFVFSNINITNAGDDGINIKTSPANVSLTDSVITGSVENGIEVDTVVNMVISNVEIFSNKLRGIEIVDYGSTVLSNVDIYRNSEEGIYSSNGEALSTNLVNITANRFAGVRAFNTNRVNLSSTIIERNGNEGVLHTIGSTLSIQDVSIKQNGFAGLRTVNVSTVYVNGTDINSNSLYGATVTASTLFEIMYSNVEDNSGFAEGSDGIRVTDVDSFVMRSVNASGNTGEGVLLDSTTFSVSSSVVSDNQKNGILLTNSAKGSILNNTISGNQMSGVFVGSNTTVVINYNVITNNQAFGVMIEQRDDLIDVNYNVWDQGALDEGRGVNDFQYANITAVLSENGVLPYSPPTSDLNQQVTTILLSLLFLAVLSVITKAVLRYRERQKYLSMTNPQVVFVSSNAGIPLAEFSFVTTQTDSVLLSGFLSAINSFSNDVVDSSNVSKKQGLEEINHQSYSILQRKHGDYQIVLIVIESNPLIRIRMNEFSRDVGVLLDNTEIDGIMLDDKFIEQFTTLAKHRFGEFRSEKIVTVASIAEEGSE